MLQGADKRTVMTAVSNVVGHLIFHLKNFGNRRDKPYT